MSFLMGPLHASAALTVDIWVTHHSGEARDGGTPLEEPAHVNWFTWRVRRKLI
jgi:hypothetical protein